MAWRNACMACGRHRNGCVCEPARDRQKAMQPVAPEAHGAGVSDADFQRVQRARRDFVRRVEEAAESGDQRDLDKRIGRFIEESK